MGDRLTAALSGLSDADLAVLRELADDAHGQKWLREVGQGDRWVALL